jgi:N6-adenosine-specific RNA methylase IME4
MEHDRRFRVILADPPWNYNRTSGDRRLSGYSDSYYLPLSTRDLCSLPVADLAHDDAVLLLWTTWPFLRDALEVVDQWGFSFVTGLPWVKVTSNERRLAYGVGYWFRGASEPLLVGKRGRAHRSPKLGILEESAGLVAERLTHSRKPRDVYDLAEHLPGPRLELFAREHRAGWTSLGNEAPGDGRDIRESIAKEVEKVRRNT